jgi:sterol 14-demethylase
MFPPLIMLMRMAMQDIETTLNGKKYTIPKGDIVITSPAVCARMESVFTKPNEFEPERFNADRSETKVPYAFLGFGGGMHACMGQQFGLLQVKTIVSILLRNFTIEPIDKEFPEPDYTAMVVGPKNHLMVRYKKIAGSAI